MLAGWTHMAKQIHTGIGVEWRAGKDRQSRIVNRLLVVVHSVHSMSDEAAYWQHIRVARLKYSRRRVGDKNMSDFRTCRDYLVLFKVNCP